MYVCMYTCLYVRKYSSYPTRARIYTSSLAFNQISTTLPKNEGTEDDIDEKEASILHFFIFRCVYTICGISFLFRSLILSIIFSPKTRDDVVTRWVLIMLEWFFVYHHYILCSIAIFHKIPSC